MKGTYIQLFRVRQWYKNIVIFLPLLFSGMLLDYASALHTFLGFVSLCIASSAGYIINDIIDRKADRENPEKKNRPIAAGLVSVSHALIWASALLLLSLCLAFFISKLFLLAVLSLFILTLIYTLWLKNIVFADILLIATNFVIRAVSGVFIINFEISPWLILCIFFLSLFLSSGKRAAELSLLSSKASAHRKTLDYYSPNITQSLITISTTLLIISYSLYSFMSKHPFMIYTLPFALFTIFRFLLLIYSGSPVARHPEYAFKIKSLVIGVLLWLISVILVLYAV